MATLRLTPGPGFVQRRSKKQAFVPREAATQTALFDWAGWARSKYPDLDLLFCIPNGMPLHGPQRFAVINWMKAQGLKPGLPDVCLPVGRGGYFSKWLELKIPGGRVSESQAIWIDRLRRAGASVSVCESYEQAVTDLEIYCRLPPTTIGSH